VTVLLVLAALGALPLGQSQSEGPTEYQVKAAFVYNFAKFVEWPGDAFESSTAPVRFCVLGQTPVGPDLEQITRGKMIAGHSIRVSLGTQNLHDCHVVFVGANYSGSVKDLREAVRGAPVLTIGENRDFAAQGGIIGFMVEEAHMRFEVNLQAANQARLAISAKLLSLAKRVIP
jgi:hypothetical protein